VAAAGIGDGKNYQIVESGKQTGGVIWVSGNYGYIRNSSKNNRLYLICRLHKGMKCPGRAIIDGDNMELEITKVHTCGQSVNVPYTYTPRKSKPKYASQDQKQQNIKQL
jgi:hypothetical protein